MPLTLPPASAYFANATVAQVCAPGWSRAHRKVPYRVKDLVYDRAGLRRHHRQGWLIDHRLPLEGGGDDDPSNLFAQPIAEAHRKDRDENYMHAQICSGQWSLPYAREWMWTRWPR